LFARERHDLCGALRDFVTLLAMSSNAFEKLRYVHEDASGSFFVGDLTVDGGLTGAPFGAPILRG